MPAELLSLFRRQTWPGNIRELRAAVERAVLLDDPLVEGLDRPQIAEATPNEAQDEADLAVPFRVAKERAAEIWEIRYLRVLMTRAKGNLSEAARLARTDRGYLRTLLRKYGLTGDDGT